MKKLFLLGLGLLVSLYAYASMAQQAQAATQQATPLPAIHKIYVFGDSLSDTGNLEAATLSFLPNAKNYFMGRFSDGYLWIDNLAENYHTTIGDNQFIKDYAVGGATAFPYANQVSVFHLAYSLVGNLSTQLNDFSKTHQQFKPSDLIMVWIGANDFLWAGDMYFCGKLTKACIEGQVQKADQGTIIQWAADSVKAQVKIMEEKYGAQHIVIIGLPDFSVIPHYIFDQPTVAALKKADIHSYNDKLKTFVKENQAAGHDILFYDFDNFLQELIHNKAELTQDNITDVLHSCLYRGKEPMPNSHWESIALDPHNPLSIYAAIPVFRDALSEPSYYSGNNLQEFVDKTCGNAYLFWDVEHPTQRGHWVISQHLLGYMHSHFDISRANTDTGLCYNLPVVNKGRYVLDVMQNSTCGPKDTLMLKNREALISVKYNEPVKFRALLGRSVSFTNLPAPVHGLGAKIVCNGGPMINFSCKQEGVS